MKHLKPEKPGLHRGRRLPAAGHPRPATRRLPFKGLFVTGTDTGVGKTLVAAGLARWVVDRGIKTGVFKPVASGGRLSADGELLRRGARLPKSAASRIVPVNFRQPLAPYVASWKEGAVPLGRVERVFKDWKESSGFLLVEGVGGIRVPVTRKLFVEDWIIRWGLPVLVVARAGLGTINHTLLTVEALLRKKAKILGVLVNGYTGRGAAERTNLKALGKLLPVPVFGPLRKDSRYRRDLDLLARHLGRLGILRGLERVRTMNPGRGN